MLNILFACCLLTIPLEEMRHVQAHLAIADYTSSVTKARELMLRYPNEVASYELLITALAGAEEHDEMLSLWEAFAQRFPEQAYKQSLLENMCWAILRKGKESLTLSTRLLATIGATLTQDAYAIDFLLAGMRDSNVTLRALSVQLAALLADHPLKEELLALLKKETKVEVRLELLQAIKKLKLVQAKEYLLNLIASRYCSAEERALAIATLLEISDSMDRRQLHRLATEKRAALRQLAAEMIAKFELQDEQDLLVRLTKDSNAEVVAAALQAIGLLRLPHLKGQSIQAYLDPFCVNQEPIVGITASWVLLQHHQQAGIQAFHNWIFHEQQQVRSLAAAAISAAGPQGLQAALIFLDKSADPYVRLNLARVLIGQRTQTEIACQILEETIRTNPHPLMQQEGSFSPIVRSELSHRPALPNYPEIVNQSIRLQLLNLLAILEYPHATDAIRDFLKSKPYGVTGLAAEVFLEEGDETAIEHVRELLQDSDKQVRAEAALVLAIWGKDSSALPVLLDIFPGADRMLKIKILEALGRVGNKETIPFLAKELKDPSMNTRLIAASVLLQCLNH